MSLASHRFDNALRRRSEDHPAQTHLTPEYVLGPVRVALGGRIGLDPCTTPDNPTRATRFYTPPVDGCLELWDAETVFCNPPYGEARERWVNRCILSGQAGSSVILLVPAHTDTRSTQAALRSCHGALLIQGRVKFGVPRPNGRQVAASHPSVLLGWNVDWEPLRHLGAILVPLGSTSAVLAELIEHVDREVWCWEQHGACSPADHEAQAAWVKAQGLLRRLRGCQEGA